MATNIGDGAYAGMTYFDGDPNYTVLCGPEVNPITKAGDREARWLELLRDNARVIDELRAQVHALTKNNMELRAQLGIDRNRMYGAGGGGGAPGAFGESHFTFGAGGGGEKK